MNNIAYLAMAIDKNTDLICGCGIFSEDSPTTISNIIIICLLICDGNGYNDAKDNMLNSLEYSHNRWYKKLYYRYNNA